MVVGIPSGSLIPAWARRALLVVGGLLSAVGLVAGHVNRTVLDGPTFAVHVDEIRRDDDVSARIGDLLVAEVLARNPDLVALRPLLASVANSVAAGDLLSGPTRRAAATMHVALSGGDTDLLVFRIADAAAIVVTAVQQFAPDTNPIPPDVAITLANIGSGQFASTGAEIAGTVGLLAWLTPLLAAACFALAIWRSPARWETAAACGWAVLWAAGGVAVLLAAGGYLARQADALTLRGALVRAAWRELTGPLWWGVVLLALAGGLVVVACASSAPMVLERVTAGARALVLERPRRPLWVVVRALVALVVGVAAIADPGSLIQPAIVLAGLGLLLFGIIEVGRVAAATRSATSPPPSTSTPTSARSRATSALGFGLGALIVVGGVVFLGRAGREVDVALVTSGDGDVCNGHSELCDRTFDDVAYVASHNAMSVVGRPGWFIGEQSDPIPTQLDQGVRALLIDVWSGIPAGDVVRTAASSHAEAKALATEAFGAEVVDAALRLADSIAGPADGAEARYLCHGLCEIGSTPFGAMLGELRTWLVMNPDEVVTLFIEDHVAAELIAADVEAAGLVPFTYTPRTDEPFPTLREMIRDGTRLVVMLETTSGGDEAPWLVDGFAWTQDTP